MAIMAIMKMMTMWSSSSRCFLILQVAENPTLQAGECSKYDDSPPE
eukprot:CAMPEP_0185796232 /NCGR_PEP_ID=MMETSP1174-20130828/160968_1 /TAXON_ID=35687 /ORGANISM="Dictyocha speculum, Strain CCMP1381" /LENGTH=45 /DNA_ID= /DNA_START= /DNA_END= /DNA_ORIENTATION=